MWSSLRLRQSTKGYLPKPRNQTTRVCKRDEVRTNDDTMATSLITSLLTLPDPNMLVERTLCTTGHRITPEEWMTAIEFLTRTGQACTPIRQEFILLSDVLGVSALVDALNNPRVGTATESSVLGPFFTEDAPDGASYSRFCASGPILGADTPPIARSPARRVDRV